MVQNDEQVEDILFDSEKIYADQVLPLLRQVTKICKDAGIGHVMEFCFLHTHAPDGTCERGVGRALSVDARRDPLKMVVMATIAEQLDEPESAIVMEVVDQLPSIRRDMKIVQRCPVERNGYMQ